MSSLPVHSPQEIASLGVNISLSRRGSAYMDNDLLAFLGSAGLLIAYLIFSAATEMGTKLPWKK